MLTINIIEDKRNTRTTTDFSHSLGWNQLKKKEKTFVSTIVVSVCCSWALGPFIDSMKSASKQFQYCIAAKKIVPLLEIAD